MSGQNVVIGDYGGVSKNIEFPGVSFYTTSSSSLLHKTFDIASQTDLGRSISINNTTVVAGAPRGEIGPNRPGNARLIDVNTHAESLISPPPSVGPDANFGNSVSLSSQYLAAGVPDYYNGFECVGSVEIFDNNGSFLRKITADLSDQNNFDSFGYSVAVSDTNNTVVLVGAPYDDQAGSDAGAAYLFDLATGNLLFKLVPSDVQSKDLFGWSVEITHNYAIIGSPDNDENGSNSGAVYVYDIGSGQFLYKMLESGGSSANRYGYSISADGYKLAIGASGGNTDLGGFNRGKAFLVDLRCNPADFAAPYGSLNFFDSSAFLAAFNSDDPDADLNGDGTWNFLDISMFTQLLSAGCN
ncbi:MAG: FG-GAP repeat protein [Phycisphaerales bacterium]|nr:FG-GAP repeat protein [Phycisphaerales bacterium]